ncbi:MAG TPA: hypothetical protein GX396_08850 [Tissierellia bacterium]|nr:hypothetical protein [Tissierellia bacterium]
MKECTIYIEAPEKILKGAGIPNSQFLPSNIYQLKIILRNNSSSPKICSFSATLGNGIRYFENIHHEGPDVMLKDLVKVVEPNKTLANNNVIIFGNNFILSPHSVNTIFFDAALCDKYTINGIENSGNKIPHRSKISFYAHLLNDEHIDSCFVSSVAMDFNMSVKIDDEEVSPGDITKYYVYLSTGQYDLTRKVYLRSILDNGLEYIGDSCNLEPKNVYEFNGKTIIKWDVGSLQPSETKAIGYKVRVKDNIKPGLLKNKLNSNSINNSTYTQCPVSCQHSLKVVG